MSKRALEKITTSTPAELVDLASVTTQTLTSQQEAEVLAFLAERPLHTVFMVSLIRDNGLLSPLNRGKFYGCRDLQGRLQGVALIGHATLMEARTVEALAAFSHIAQNCASTHVVMGEEQQIEAFWEGYADRGRPPRLLRREFLFEQRWPVEAREPVPGLRQATVEDLPWLMPVNAQLALEECEVNPLIADPEGFRRRLSRRIEQGRLWVWVADGELIFKVDLIAESPEVIYLEGIYVAPKHRGKGYGRRCMSQLSRQLLQRANSLCLLVNDENKAAQDFYRKAGYKVSALYHTIYLQKMKGNDS
jgi:ribosomal protein S18 acetylase RimI-like enzyme